MVLLFVMQFSIGVAALSVSQTQQKQLLSEGWCKLSDERQIWFQNSTNCYGFEVSAKARSAATWMNNGDVARTAYC